MLTVRNYFIIFKFCKYVLKRVYLGSKDSTKELKLECEYLLGQTIGVISDPLIVSKFHYETHDPKGQENKIYTTVWPGPKVIKTFSMSNLAEHEINPAHKC